MYRNPTPTVDIIITLETGEIVLIERKNHPRGLAIPGGFIDYGESAEWAAIREAKEETGLDIELRILLGVYSVPDRDPRQHNLSIVYVARPSNPDQKPSAGDDAGRIELIRPELVTHYEMAFDHFDIIQDFLDWQATDVRPLPQVKNFKPA